jgi:hypothetical protein
MKRYERQVVGGAAKEGLAKMNVSLHKARKNGTTLRLNNDVRRLACLSDGRYAPITNE